MRSGAIEGTSGSRGQNPPVALMPETESRVQAIGDAEILVGIPSYNNVDTIAHVVRAVSAGLVKYFPVRRAVLVNSDVGSSDGTLEAVSRAVVDFSVLLVSDHQRLLQKVITPYHGNPGKGSAFRTVFEIARRLKAKACAVVNSDLRSITPEWIELLLPPILDEQYDYVAPYYLRHKYDGTITNNIVYPLTRALYGQRIRQPIGADFGLSGGLTEHYLDQHVGIGCGAIRDRPLDDDRGHRQRRQGVPKVFSEPRSTTPRIHRPIWPPC